MIRMVKKNPAMIVRKAYFAGRLIKRFLKLIPSTLIILLFASIIVITVMQIAVIHTPKKSSTPKVVKMSPSSDTPWMPAQHDAYDFRSVFTSPSSRFGSSQFPDAPIVNALASKNQESYPASTSRGISNFSSLGSSNVDSGQKVPTHVGSGHFDVEKQEKLERGETGSGVGTGGGVEKHQSQDEITRDARNISLKLGRFTNNQEQMLRSRDFAINRGEQGQNKQRRILNGSLSKNETISLLTWLETRGKNGKIVNSSANTNTNSTIHSPSMNVPESLERRIIQLIRRELLRKHGIDRIVSEVDVKSENYTGRSDETMKNEGIISPSELQEEEGDGEEGRGNGDNGREEILNEREENDLNFSRLSDLIGLLVGNKNEEMTTSVQGTEESEEEKEGEKMAQEQVMSSEGTRYIGESSTRSETKSRGSSSVNTGKNITKDQRKDEKAEQEKEPWAERGQNEASSVRSRTTRVGAHEALVMDTELKQRQVDGEKTARKGSDKSAKEERKMLDEESEEKPNTNHFQLTERIISTKVNVTAERKSEKGETYSSPSPSFSSLVSTRNSSNGIPSILPPSSLSGSTRLSHSSPVTVSSSYSKLINKTRESQSGQIGGEDPNQNNNVSSSHDDEQNEELHDHGHHHIGDSSLHHETYELMLNESKKMKRNKTSSLFSSVSVSELQPTNAVYDESIMCPMVPPFLVGRIKLNMNPNVGENMSNVIRMNPKVKLGGSFEPSDCKSRSVIAIIIPFRDRQIHLSILLYYLHPLLQRQQINYQIYVVEQFGDDTFNKGVLMNAGVIEALKSNPNIQCFIFHDVDLIPEDDRNLYNCPTTSPRHMSPAIDKFNYTLPYDYLVGGVFAISKEHYKLVNGYSNLYWGWGGEDDDMAHRMSGKKLKILRPPPSVGRYSMIRHNHRKESPSNVRSALLRMAKRRASRDGLSSVYYTVKSKLIHPLFTKISVEIGHIHKWHFPAPNKLVLHF